MSGADDFDAWIAEEANKARPDTYGPGNDFDAWIAEEANKARPDTYGPGNDFGAVVPGTMDMSKRPYVLNRDGSHSTVYSESGGKDDKSPQVLYPRVAADGHFMSSNEAYNSATTGGKNMGTYANIDQAESGAQAFHDYYDQHPAARTMSVYSGINPEDDIRQNGAASKVPEMTDEEVLARYASHR